MSSRFNFFFTEALRSLSTNVATSVAATVTMLIAIFMVGFFMVLLSLVYNKAQTVAYDASRVKVYLKETVTEEELNALRAQMEKMPEVASVTYVNKDTALKEAKKRFSENPEMLRYLRGNPFPARVEAKLKDPTKSTVVAGRMKGQPGVNDIETGGPTARKVVRGAMWLSGLVLGIGLFLIAAATLLVANTIRLSIFARRREIEVMKLVGAANSFVRLPFMIEGFIVGIVAAFGAVLMLIACQQVFKSIFENISVSSLASVDKALIFLGKFAMGMLLGTLGSGMTIRKYLRV